MSYTIVRPSGNEKPVGAVSEIEAKGLHLGDVVEITNMKRETINVAEVVSVSRGRAVIVMVA
jgi:hypothetical protein